MNYHPVVQKIRGLLESNNIDYKFFEHEAVRTSEEAAALRPGYTLEQGAKALVIRVKNPGADNTFVMAVVPADRKLDSKKLRKVVSAKKISFATAKETSELTGGVEFGGVPPFGNLFNLFVIVDPGLLKNKEIIFNCGDKRASIAISTDDYIKVVKPSIQEIV